MLRHELYCMIHVPRLKDGNAAELFLGFRMGAVRVAALLTEGREFRLILSVTVSSSEAQHILI